MATGCTARAAKCANCMFIFFNVIFWLTGSATLGFSIWIRVDRSILDNIKVLSVDEDDPLLEYASNILTGTGALVWIVGFLGCCGIIKKNKRMLGLYIFSLLLIMAGELAAGLLAMCYKNDIIGTITDVLTARLQNDTIYSSEKGAKEIEFTAFGLAMSASQVELKCCGINDFTDYVESAFLKKYDQAFPLTCCEMKEGTEIIDAINLEDSVLDVIKCQEEDPEFINSQGCKDGLETALSANTYMFIDISIGAACLQIFSLIFAVSVMLLPNTSEPTPSRTVRIEGIPYEGFDESENWTTCSGSHIGIDSIKTQD